ncbi:M48 family metallopeptidase [Alishewanella sp. d11]|uniref:M48 family metallopeptidase n=1 Tax=Alishewanella sp. d11 TaxID=3414030 RepID=UPI003BF818A4
MALVQSRTLPFQYEVIFSPRRRSIQLAVVQGQLKVRAPLGTSEVFLQALLQKKQAWVLKHLQLSCTLAKPDWHERTQILLGGEPRDFSWCLASKAKIEICEQGLLVQVPTRVNADKRAVYIQNLVQRHLMTLAMSFFEQCVEQQSKVMALTPSAVRIGNWQRRWGCCDNRGVVGFNWRLMQAPPWVANYVVIHELAHLRFMNHSAAFWQLVHQFCPDYPAAQQWLKQHQTLLL